MSYKKSSLSSTQTSKVSKSKGFILSKCLQMTGLTKSFFNCKANSTRAVNYECAPYLKQDQEQNSASFVSSIDDSIMEFSNLPSSTMIESKSESQFESSSLSYQLMSNENTSYDQTSTISNIERHIMKPSYVTIPSFEQSESDSTFLVETEHTRRRSSILSLSTFQTDATSCETVIQHNNSPLSDYRARYHDNSGSETILYECLQSTAISSSTKQCDTCSQCQMAAPQTSLSPFSVKSKLSLDSSPLLSSSVSSVSPPVDIKDHLNESTINDVSAQPYESMISFLSSTLKDTNSNATHICTSNYEATFVDDVTVKFADMVKVLRSNSNDEWVQVQVASDGRTGFVPKKIVLDIKQFIGQLKQTSKSTLDD